MPGLQPSFWAIVLWLESAVGAADTTPAAAGLGGASLHDSLSALQFRNPAGLGRGRASDTTTHREQCVLYSEIDNVTSVNKGWDVGSGVGWNLSYPYGANGSAPPTGIRSAVPLGGMGTGNFELRGDGTFRQWCIESQSPGGGAKLDVGALNEAVLGVRVASQAALLRTHPPAGLPGVAAMTYQGAVPISKLTVEDPVALGPAKLSLYAHGELVPWDSNGSMTPAVAFTLTVSNPTQTALETSLLLSLPLASQPNTGRIGPAGTCAPQGAKSSLACKSACDGETSCSAWSFETADALGGGCACQLISGGAPQNVFKEGTTSGIKGTWTEHSGGGTTLVHDRSAAASAPPAPPRPKLHCNDSRVVAGFDIDGSIVGTVAQVPEGQAGFDACRLRCCSTTGCNAWVVSSDAAPPGATPAPCVHGKPCCWMKGGDAKQGPARRYCTSSVWDARSGGGAAVVNEQVGNFALHVPSSGGAKGTAFTADTLPDIWSQFQKQQRASAGGSLPMAPPPLRVAVHGAVSSTVTVPPGGNATLTIVFGWHFRTRYFTNKPIGNYYAEHLHADAASAASGLAARLPDVVSTIAGWHSAFFNADSLPVWLQDVIVNSMSQWRSAFMTADGRWRQWEAYDCVDVDR